MMAGNPALDLAGKKFGKLTVERRMANRGGMGVWLCKCDCGSEKAVFAHNLNRVNGTRSCGCSRGSAKRAKSRPRYASDDRPTLAMMMANHYDKSGALAVRRVSVPGWGCVVERAAP